MDGYGLFSKDMATMGRFYRDIPGFEIREDADHVYLIEDDTLFLLYRRSG